MPIIQFQQSMTNVDRVKAENLQWVRLKPNKTIKHKIKVIPVASTNPTRQSKSLRRTRQGFWSHIGAKTGWGNSHGNPLNRSHNTTHILASHSSHVVPQVVLKSELECDGQDRSKVIIVWLTITSWVVATRAHFKCRSQIQCTSCSRPIL